MDRITPQAAESTFHRGSASTSTASLVDMLLMAINPALIMGMVGSLVFFLLQLTYEGTFQGRIHWVFTLFVFATVLIARIAIELGNDRALPFGLALACVVGLVLTAFKLSPWLTGVFLAVIWWCVHRLTWDCTVLSRDPEGTGEGLMQALGWEADTDGPMADPQANREPNRSPTTSAESVQPQRASGGSRWWQVLWGTTGRPTSPGSTVFLFACGAIPLFGVGSLFLGSDADARRYAFQLFFCYLTCGLGLLVTTGLLRLRQYLGKRHVELTYAAAESWLLAGAGLVVTLLGCAMLLPRPGAEYAISRPPDWPTLNQQPPRHTSRHAIGHDGWHAGEDARSIRPDSSRSPSADSQHAGSQNADSQNSDSQTADRQNSESPNSDSQDSDSSSPQHSTPESQSADDRHASASSESQDASPPQTPSSNHGSAETNGDSGSPGPPQTNPASPHTAPEAGDPERGSSESNDPFATPGEELQGQSTAVMSERPANRPARTSLLTSLPQLLGNLLHWMLHLLFWIVAAVVAWRSRGAIAAALWDLWNSWKNWFHGGRGSPLSPEIASPTVLPPRRRFCDIVNPFTSSQPVSATEIVRRTLEGVEAWADERELGRPPHQSVDEFTRRLSSQWPDLRTDVDLLLRLHAQVTYAGRAVTAQEAARLRRLWSRLGRAD